ncbi:MAG: hypothetical protein ACWA40_09675 [Planktomarina sp.]
MTHSILTTRRHVLAAAPMAGIAAALPAMAATDTDIGRGFVRWRQMKRRLSRSPHDLDDQNHDYVAWCAFQDDLMVLPCQCMTDLAAKIVMDTQFGTFELSDALIDEIHRISGV